MDYTTNWYERVQPLGRYDRAAVAFGYGDLVEAYDGDDGARRAARGVPRLPRRRESARPTPTARTPRAASRARSCSTANRERGPDPALRREPARRGSAASSARASTTTSRRRPRTAATTSRSRYRFCTDERADTTLAWCNRFDEGANYREIVRNVAGRLRAHVPVLGVPALPQGLQHRRLRRRVLSRRFDDPAEHLSEPAVPLHVGPRVPQARTDRSASTTSSWRRPTS